MCRADLEWPVTPLCLLILGTDEAGPPSSSLDVEKLLADLFVNWNTIAYSSIRILSRLRVIPSTTIIISYNGTDFRVIKLFTVIMIVKRAFWILF